MAAFVNTYFSESSSEMQRLGTELKQTMLDALADGVIDEQEMKTINDLQSEVNQMLSMVLTLSIEQSSTMQYMSLVETYHMRV